MRECFSVKTGLTLCRGTVALIQKKNNGQRRKRQGEMEKEKGGEKTDTVSHALYQIHFELKASLAK